MPTRALPLSDLASEPRLLAETIRLLVERSRMAFALIIAAVLAFAVADATVNGHVLGPLLAIAAFQIVSAAVGMVALRGAPSRLRAVAVPVVVLGLVFWSGAVSDVLSANAYPTLTMSLLAALVSGALMPWGLWPQVVVSASMIGAGVTAFAVVQQSLAAVGHLVVGFATTGAASVFIAHAFERSRVERGSSSPIPASARRSSSMARSTSASLMPAT